MMMQDFAVPQPHHSEPPREEQDPTPRTVDWNNPRVAAILEAAAKCFSRKGFSATTLAEIGKELGLRKSIVHYYFASKAALIHEVQSYTYHKYLERVRDAVRSDLGPGERSAQGIHALWDAAGDGNVGLNIEVWSASRNDDELKRRAAALQKEKRKLVAQSIADMLGADPSRIRESLCTLVLSVVNGLTVCEYVEGEGARAQESFDIFVSLLRAGLQNLDAPQSPTSTAPQMVHPAAPPVSQQVPVMQPSTLPPASSHPVAAHPAPPRPHSSVPPAEAYAPVPPAEAYAPPAEAYAPVPQAEAYAPPAEAYAPVPQAEAYAPPAEAYAPPAEAYAPVPQAEAYAPPAEAYAPVPQAEAYASPAEAYAVPQPSSAPPPIMPAPQDSFAQHVPESTPPDSYGASSTAQPGQQPASSQSGQANPGISPSHGVKGPPQHHG